MMNLSSGSASEALEKEYTPAEEAAWTKELSDYLTGEAARFNDARLPRYELIIVRIYDGGSFIAWPSMNVLPHAYPESKKEVDRDDTHFTYAIGWELKSHYVRKFDEMYYKLPDAEQSDTAFEKAFDKLTALKIAALKKACAGLDPTIQVLGFIHDSPLWIPRAIHLHGPPVPEPAPPHSDVAVFSRLRHHNYSYVSQTAFGWDGDHIAKVNLSGANLDDLAFEFVWKIPDLKSLCPALKEITMDHSSVTPKAVEKLRSLLPGVKISYTPRLP